MKRCGSVCTFDMITIFVWVGTTFRFFVLNFHSIFCGLLEIIFESQGMEGGTTKEDDREGRGEVERNKRFFPTNSCLNTNFLEKAHSILNLAALTTLQP